MAQNGYGHPATGDARQIHIESTIDDLRIIKILAIAAG